MNKEETDTWKSGAYAFFVVLTNICAIISFVSMSSASYTHTSTVFDQDKEEYVKSTTTISYDDYSSLRYGMSTQITTWIFTLGVLFSIVACDILGVWTETPRLMKRIDRGFILSCFMAYSGALAQSAISTDCRCRTINLNCLIKFFRANKLSNIVHHLCLPAFLSLKRNDNGTTIKKYDGGVKHDVKKFCHKVGASTTFMWFAVFALYLAAAIRYYDRFLAPKEIKATTVAQDSPTESVAAPSEPPQSSEVLGSHDL
jgi:hypothetical protein